MRLNNVAPVLLLCALAAPARAAEYEVFIDVDSEEALFDLLESEQISQETFEILVELLRQGVNLDSASREELYTLPNLSYDEVDGILGYRRDNGRVGDPANLVAAGVLSEPKLIAIAPFLVVETARPLDYATTGWVRAPMVLLPNSPDVPSMALLGRATTFKRLTVGGVGVVTHSRLGAVRFDPLRGALTAEEATISPALPKIFVSWEEPGFAVIAGSYRIGFGQRLTFDDTSRYTPNGFFPDADVTRGSSLATACRESQGELDASPCAGAAGSEYEVPDFRWRQGLFGVAVGKRNIDAGAGKLQLFGWASSAERDIYQYELYDAGKCENPENDADPSCAAPNVFKTLDDPLAPTSRFSFSTLPGMFQETTVGANIGWFTGHTTHLGATAYLSRVDWLVEGIDLDFQEYSRYPRGGMFGAVGVDGALRVNQADLFVEVTRSFDETPGGGGDFGAVLRAVAAFKRQEVEASLRWFGADFVNPYARPIAAPDESGGQRVRDEAGVRVRYTGNIDRRFSLRAAADLWVNPSTSTPKTLIYARGDYRVTRKLGVGLWASFSDKDLSQGGVADPMTGVITTCYETTFETDETGEPLDCTGQKWQAALRFKVTPNKQLVLSAQYGHEFLDDADYPGEKRQDVSAWAAVTYKPTPATRLKLRTRFLDEDVADNTSLERSWWSYVEVAYRYQKRWRARVRYDLYFWLDDRDATMERESPEQWLWLEMEARF